MNNFFDYTLDDLSQCFASQGIASAHAKTLFFHKYKRFSEALDFSQEGQLPRTLTTQISDDFWRVPVTIDEFHLSDRDDSVKFALRLDDGQIIEAVLMPEKSRLTLCVSSQVGCAQACSFCYTGRMGLLRNLTAAEIVGQVWLTQSWVLKNPSFFALPHLRKISNLVFMGMGEPLDNVENVLQAAAILSDNTGLNIGPRRISVSTAGHLDGLEVLLASPLRLPVAISLHSPFDSERSRIMPINRRWPLAKVIDAIRKINVISGRAVLIQYTLIAGVNDSLLHARALVELLKDLDVKVNLIPLNEISPSNFRPPSVSVIQNFRQILYDARIRSMIRYSKGPDIAAACGQLFNLRQPSFQST